MTILPEPANDPAPIPLRIAFASTSRTHVDQHFGGSEGFVLFDVIPGSADLVGVARFPKAEQGGESNRQGSTDSIDDKVIPKLEFVDGCAAVYAAAIGSSSIRRLMSAQIQPIIVDEGHDIVDLLNEVSLAMVYGGLSWVEKAQRRLGERGRADAKIAPDSTTRTRLIASIDELE